MRSDAEWKEENIKQHHCSGSELAQRAARGFEIWTVVNEGSVTASYVHTRAHTQIDRPDGP